MPPLSSTQPTSLPPLTPTFCYTPLALRTFLNRSRTLTDDTIPQQLSALSRPSATPFTPHDALPPARIPSSSHLSEQTCSSFITNTLLPIWSSRSEIIQYCSQVAEQEDVNDPERAIREEEQRKRQEAIVNERLDPYSGRFQVRESRRDRLKREVQEEWRIEDIVRSRSWEVLKSRCRALGNEWKDLAPVPEGAKSPENDWYGRKAG
jgi:hypothetical protein